MKKINSLLSAISICLIFCFAATTFLLAQQPQTLKTYRFTNGNWLDGKTFKRKVFYSVSGVLTNRKPAKIDETIDLKNGFVIPPLADAHCHHFDGPYNVAQQIEMYLRDGVFYAKVLTNSRSGALKVADKVNKPESVDVSYAHGGLTSSYGHPIGVYEGMPALGKPGAETPEEVQKLRGSHLAENDAYYIINNEQDLKDKWPKILAGKPNFIKVFLLTSEEYAERVKRTDTIGEIGLDPKLVPLIVQKAHAAGLRVSAHVDTVTDYRIALKAGVDEMAHLPGYGYVVSDRRSQSEKYLLNEDDAQETARRKVWVVPAPVPLPDEEKIDLAKVDNFLQENLRLIKKYRVKIAFASDWYGRTPIDNVFQIATYNVFSNLEILKIWCEDTPQTIFPNRKIGRLHEGYEASFIVLGGNPLADLTQIKNIGLRFKQGFLITVAEGGDAK